MATEAKFNTDDEDQQETLSGVPSAVGAPAGSVTAQRPATPSGRPNVQQYLQANQGAGQRLASGIEKNVNKDAQSLGRSVDQSRSSLQTGSNPLESKLGQQGSDFAKASFKDPQALLNQQSQLDEFRRLQQEGYKGDIQNLGAQTASQQQGLQNQYSNLDKRVGQAGSETGRFDLLRSSLGQPNYSRGAQRLDQLFLQAQPGVNRTLQQNLKGVGAQGQQQVGAFSDEAKARLEALSGLSGQRSSEIANLLKGGTETGLESDLSGRGLEDIGVSSQQRLIQAQAAAEAVPGLQDRLTKNQLTAEDMQTLGLQAGSQIYDTDLLKYITRGEHLPTITSAADPAEFARYRALQQLSGDTSGDIYGGATEAGGFSPYQFDREGLMQNASNRRDYWETTKPRELANAVTNEFGPINTPGFTGLTGGFRAAGPSPVAQYGANVLAPALQQATTVDEMQQILSRYDQMLSGFGLNMDTLNPATALYEPLQNLKKHLAQATQYRQRNLQPAPTAPQSNFSNTFGVV